MDGEQPVSNLGGDLRENAHGGEFLLDTVGEGAHGIHLHGFGGVGFVILTHQVVTDIGKGDGINMF